MPPNSAMSRERRTSFRFLLLSVVHLFLSEMIASMVDLSPEAAAVAVVALTVVYFAWRQLRHHLEAKKPFGDQLPTPPGNHWLLGHVGIFRNEFRSVHQELCYDYADHYGVTSFWLTSHKGVTVTNYQDARAILQASVDHVLVPIMRRHLSQFIGGNNIGVMNGKEWKYHRAAILRVFHSQTTLQNSRRAMVSVAQALVDSLKRQQPQPVNMDVDDLMKMITMDVFGQTALSVDLECCKNLEPSPFAVAFDFLGNEVMRRLRNPMLPSNAFYSLPTETNRRHAQARSTIRDFLHNLIETRRQEKPEDRKPDLLTSLLKAHEEQESKVVAMQEMTDEMLVDNMMALLFAGFDTTSITLMYALYLVATHPDVEERCLEEINRVYKEDGNLEDPNRLVYCGGVVSETLRMYPPAFVVSRKATKPLQLSNGFIVPEDTFVLIPIYMIQHDPKHFEHPEEFHAERWVKNDGNSGWMERDMEDTSYDVPAGNRNAIFAFSGGARSCAAQKFAIQEAVLVFATLLKELKFTAKPGYVPEPIRHGIVQSPKEGMPMTISARQ